MSRHHRKSLKRGIKQPLEDREQRVRASRHGKPQTNRRWHAEERIVPSGTPGATRHVAEVDGQVVIQYRISVQSSRQVPVTEPFKMHVAKGPTATVGKKNDGGVKAGKKAEKPKAA
jgi:hypothetical protein